MFIDIDCHQQKKFGQSAYGDYFTSKRYPDSGRLVAVLSDGLGSGIKADILACMTATMLLKFIEAESDIAKACEIIMNSLPVCQVRKISYSTFSAIDYEDGTAKIVEEGNPEFIWIRGGRVLQPPYEVITSKTFPNRHMHIYHISLQLEDRLIFCSDGVTQAGIGSRELNLGLRREGLIKVLEDILKKRPSISSSDLSKAIVRAAQDVEPGRKAIDDISAVSIYCRMPRNALVFTGPPYYQDKDNYYARIFNAFEGKKAVCGGTTANLVSRELGVPVETPLSMNIGDLPGLSTMDGVDLVTEGILTLTRTSEYLEQTRTSYPDDAAGRLVEFLLDSDCITFMVGARLNQAHYDPNLPVEIEIRKNVVKKIANLLENKFMKKIIIQYM